MLWTIVRILSAVVLVVACTIVVAELDPALDFANDPLHIQLNLLPVLLLILLLCGIFRRIWASFACVFLILFFMFFINEQKLLSLNEPLMFADVMLVVQIATGWGLMKQYVADWVYLVMLVVPIGIVLLCWLEKPAKWQVALLPLTLGAAGFYFLMVGNTAPATHYNVWNNDSAPWDFDKVAENQGLIASLVVGGQMVGIKKPAFEPSTIENFIASLSDFDNEHATSFQPDIILWLSESFFDPSILKDSNSCEIWPLWCELTVQGHSSRIAVNTFGGNTTRTEFEVLTGIPVPALKGHHFPYLSVINSPTNSIAWQLKASGYTTRAIHPHDRKFWRRHRALPRLGIDEFEGEEAFPEARRDGYFIADEELTTRVISHLDEAQAPTFILAISMENHGPWGSRGNMDEARLATIAAPPALDEELARAWREYLYHGENAVNELARLYEYINTRERPTLIVFFGDHLPGLTPIFDALQFQDEQLGAYSPLPAVALANYQMEPAWLPKNAYELGVWTLNLAGQLGTHNYRDMNYVFRKLYNGESSEGATYAALSAMQMRQLHLPASPQFLNE